MEDSAPAHSTGIFPHFVVLIDREEADVQSFYFGTTNTGKAEIQDIFEIDKSTLQHAPCVVCDPWLNAFCEGKDYEELTRVSFMQDGFENDLIWECVFTMPPKGL